MVEKLKAEKRTKSGTKACKALRMEGKLPAVVYGDSKEADMISVSMKDFEQVWKKAGESSIFTLEGLEKEKSVLIQDVTLDPLYGTPLHADFYAVQTDKEVTVEIPLVFEGVAPAEKELGGTLIKVLRSIEIEALPKNLPKEIVVDVANLKTFEDQLHVKDLALPAGVKATAVPDEVVALVQEAKEETEEVGPVDVSAVEVEKKGKEVTGEAAE